MKKTLLILFALCIGFSTYGQIRRDRNRIPQTNTEPSDAEIEKRKREVEERKKEFIANFLSTLQADEFQKEIAKQHINSFFEKKIAILKTPFDHSLERKEAIESLENTHFKELEELISESDMTKIKDMIKGGFDEDEVKKKKKKEKKKKRKKKKKKEKDSDDGK